MRRGLFSCSLTLMANSNLKIGYSTVRSCNHTFKCYQLCRRRVGQAGRSAAGEQSSYLFLVNKLQQIRAFLQSACSGGVCIS
ncbi:hypothetical protein I7I53_03855 [Histoplasma capsulatum var. duboisii H88]|uniref:Uncharacterized protein n=1 Tax=Ajellomyces capsulatus (strain H88) TaxID=544711 RepID=A0A8A1LPJ8_AJEC8|nr:hypothetical protein I7I53_03855 [Histoplasma capsulatum var. duboisii H88]